GRRSARRRVRRRGLPAQRRPHAAPRRGLPEARPPRRRRGDEAGALRRDHPAGGLARSGGPTLGSVRGPRRASGGGPVPGVDDRVSRADVSRNSRVPPRRYPMRSILSVSVLLAGLAPAWGQPDEAQRPRARNVVVVTLDGFRPEDFFGGADAALI